MSFLNETGQSFLDNNKTYDQIKQEWFNQWFNKSGSFNSLKGATAAMRCYEAFVSEKYPTMTKEGIIDDLKKIWDNPSKFSQLYMFINDFAQYQVAKKKNPATIRHYTMFIKSFLRQFGIRIHNDDMKQFVHFPKQNKELRKPMTLDIIRMLYANSGRKYRSLILCAVSSGARLGELLQSRKGDFFEIKIDDKTAIQYRLRAEITKTREERKTFISHEAWNDLQFHFQGKSDNDYNFIQDWNKETIVKAEGAFNQIRERCGFTEKYGNGFNYHVNFHSLRAYFLTKATQKVGENIAHAWIGHHKYLDQYFRLTIDEQAKLYLDLEPELRVNKV